ncbi:MAG TPA: hypothetical protein VIW92_07045, partial [Thermoanaerobaculia bacterium]
MKWVQVAFLAIAELLALTVWFSASAVAPASCRCTFSDASANASALSRSSPRGAWSVSRSLPLICTA